MAVGWHTGIGVVGLRCLLINRVGVEKALDSEVAKLIIWTNWVGYGASVLMNIRGMFFRAMLGWIPFDTALLI